MIFLKEYLDDIFKRIFLKNIFKKYIKKHYLIYFFNIKY